MTQKVLVKWDSNWADEMDVEGFAVIEESKWEDLKASIKKKTRPFCLYVGTNEEIEYDCGKDLLDELVVKKITPEESKIIKKFLGLEFGFIEFLTAGDPDDDDEYDEEEENFED